VCSSTFTDNGKPSTVYALLSSPATDYAANAPVWDDGIWAPLPELTERTTADVCVIGLGGSGLTAVEELLALGKRVVGIDAGMVGGGAAGRNGGVLRAGVRLPHHLAIPDIGHERALELYRRTAVEIDRLDEDTPGLVRRVGTLRIAGNDADRADCARQLDVMRTDGIAVEAYDGPLGHGVFTPRNGAFDPLAWCRTRAKRAIGRGARLHERSAAVEFGGRGVVTQRGRVSCAAVIVAVDGRLDALVPSLAGTVRTARLQMLATAPEPTVRIPCPMSLAGGFNYTQQLPDGRIALGGGRHIAMDTEWTSDESPTAQIQSYLDGVLRDQLGVRAPITHRWAANVAYTPNGLPILREVDPNVWVIGAYSGTGILLGALCGRAVARLACGLDSDLPAVLGAVH